jgi:site-specific DNA recombinase
LGVLTSDFYGRKSTKDAGRSAARQERDWLADCQREGFATGRRFVDPDLSASQYATKSRPDFLALVDHLTSLPEIPHRAPAQRTVSLWESSRGSRETGEWMSFLRLCAKRGVLIRVFGGEDPRTFDVRKSRDWKILAEEGLEADYESRRMSDRIRDGVRDAATQGRPHGRLGYGYTREYGVVDGKRQCVGQVVNEQQYAVIRRWVADTLAGKSLNAQAAALNEAGVPTASGDGTWQGHIIRRNLLNPMYLGRRLHHGQVTAEECWPQIITEDEHRRLVSILTAPGRRAPGGSQLKYQLTAAAACGLCGGPIRTTGAKPADRRAGHLSARYRCSECLRVSVRCSDADGLINRMMVARLRLPDALPMFAPAPARNDAAAQAAKAEKDALAERLADAKREWKAGRITAGSFGEFERDLTPQLEAAEKRYRGLTTPTALQGMDPLEVADRWPGLPPAMRREVIVGLAEVLIFPIGQGNRWTPWRMAESRWRGDDLTWGQTWTQAGEAPN